MITSKWIDRICIGAVIAALILTAIVTCGRAAVDAAGTSSGTTMGYEARLFDTSKVHTIDIVMDDDDWDDLIENAEDEEYVSCAVVIDGEKYKNVAIRAKGNTSLSQVAQMDSDRYSFKIEFDHYVDGRTYYGLDKLCLNNIIQDSTYMKDYLTYTMMNAFGVDSPLCSYVWITVNGEDWGLYLAVEGVEDGFLERNYDSTGNLYKPDSMSFGGGRGNGGDFHMSDFMDKMEEAQGDAEGEDSDSGDSDESGAADDNDDSNGSTSGHRSFPGAPGNGGPGGNGGGFGGMGSDDVKLIYSDDDPDSYSNIFDNAKTDIDEDDEDRLIASLKKLNEEEDLEDTVDVDEVIRYFVVHNYVCNGDSYTGAMIHNYYLYENNGKLSMIPWDYNLAFGTFQASDDATSTVNSPIDTPVSGGTTDDRPMWDWIYDNEEYLEQYHEYFQEFLDTVDIQQIIEDTYELIAPYVEKDPTAFYTYDEFETGVAALKTFCQLRTESIEGQLDGTIPSTTEGQSADSSSLIDGSSLNLSDMGTQNQGGGQGGPGGGHDSGGPGGDHENGGPGDGHDSGGPGGDYERSGPGGEGEDSSSGN